MSPGRRPVIGLCAANEKTSYRVWDKESTMLPRVYADRVLAAGGQPVLLPPDPTLSHRPGDALDLLDGLMLAGGSDIDPASYGGSPHPEVQETDSERDETEIALARGALDRELPVLGVCRGSQLLNVALGGTLIPHLPDVLDSTRHSERPGHFADHEVRLAPGSLAARVAGGERTAVKSHHHQGLDRLGEGLVATGWSVLDDLVEAVEATAHRFALGVLWHPEEDERSPVVGSFVAAAAG
jgi:putative glutamine amidotransferase